MAKTAPYEEWVAPWEKDGKTFDAETAKKFVHNLLVERDERDASISSLRAENKAITKDLETAKDASLTAEERAEKAAREAQAGTGAQEKLALENARYRVALEKGLNARQLRYLTGADEAELAENADQILEDFPDAAPKDPNPGPKSQQPKPHMKTGNEPVDDNFPSDASTPEDAANFLPTTGWE